VRGSGARDDGAEEAEDVRGVRNRYEGCMRCGDPVPSGESVCGLCNPAGLPSPSRSQYHATVFIVVIITLVLVAGWLIVRG
jgi:predicted nucleic acid-binding Zn ribbon protein